jgi:hypothetical protein
MRLPTCLIPTLLLVALFAGPAYSASPRDELLRLVPDDVAFCAVLQDLRDHYTALAGSPLFAELKAAKTPELAKLAELEKFLKQHLGTDFAQLRDDIFGDAFVFAFKPGPPGKPDQEQGIFLVRARNETVLTNLVDRLNKAQQALGELKSLEERKHNGVIYYARIEKNQPATFYVLRGPVLMFSPQEDMLRRAIDLDRQAKSADDATPTITKHLRQLGADKAMFALWLNPRAFDAEIRQRAANAPSGEVAFLKTFVRYWDALDGLVLSVAVPKDLELNLAVRVQPEKLSPAARRFLSEGSKPSALWSAFPRDVILATAGRCDVAALIELCGEFVDEETKRGIRDSLQQNAGPAIAKAVHNLVATFGPDVGMYVAAPPSNAGWFPEMLWAVRVRPGPDGKPTEQPILDAINFFANLAVLDHNSKNADRMTLKTVQQNDVEVKYFVNEKQFPPGLQPAYAIKDGFLVFASSPEVMRRFTMRNAKPSDDNGEVPMYRLSMTAMRSYLKERREPIVAAIAEKHQIGKTEAASQVDNLMNALQFADTIELIQRPSDGQVILTLRIKPTQPLRK